MTPYCLGVSGREEKRRLYLENSVSHSIFLNNNQKRENKYINIMCTTLEKIFLDNKIDICDVLKIDTEGSEYETLYNCPKFILKRIKKIILECHSIKSFKNYNTTSMKKFLISNGFLIKSVNKNVICATNKKYKKK